MPRKAAEAKPSTALTVEALGHAITLSLADLQAMPQTTVTAFNAHNKQTETYSGPLVADVLAKAGLSLSGATQRQVLDSYVLASGTDGYFVIFSGVEVQPGLQKTQTIVAIARSGQPLSVTGAFQLIDPADAKPARWVRNLNALRVMAVSDPLH